MSEHRSWQRAAAFSARAHQGQLRKDAITPYAAHPARVALTLACVFDCTDPTIITAALLHDTIEDTGVDYDALHKRFGVAVADIVAALTKDMRLIEAEREPAYDAQLAAGPWQARLIKLADVYDNLSDVTDQKAMDRIMDRARRALELTEADDALQRARTALEQLVNDRGGS